MNTQEFYNLKRGDLFWFTAHMYAYRFIGRGRVYMTVDRTEDGSRRRVRYSNAVPTLMSRIPMPGQKVGSGDEGQASRRMAAEGE